MIKFWLVKSEPSCFSIDDLIKAPEQTTAWDGVRNYQARNYMQKEMTRGDLLLFYHSSCNPPGIVGTAEVVSEAYPDFTAFNPFSDHPDPNSSPEKPRWFMVDIKFKEKFPKMITLDELRKFPQLKDMPLLRKGNRLSVMPVKKDEWMFIMSLLK